MYRTSIKFDVAQPIYSIMMKRSILIMITSVLVCTAMCSQIQYGSGIDTDFDSFGISAKLKFDITDEWGGQAGFSWFLNNSNPSRIDLDGTYLLTTTGESDGIEIKGLAGLNYWSSGVSGAGGELGINIGGNVSFPINEDYYYIEPRITLISNAAFFVGIGTYF